MLRRLLLLLGAVLLVGCSEPLRSRGPEGGDDYLASARTPAIDRSETMAGQKAKKEAAAEPEEKEEPITRKVVYTGWMRVEVEDYPASLKKLHELIKDVKGVLARSDETGRSGYRRTAVLEARIPAGSVEDFRAQVAILGEVQQNKLDSRDVTGQFYDAKGELRSLEKELADFEELRKAQAKKGADLTTVTQQVHRVRREIDTIKNRLARISSLVELTTFTVELVERRPYTPEEAPPLPTRIGRSFSDSLAALGAALQWLVLAVVAVVPWLVGLAVVVVPVVFVLRAVRGQQPPAPSGPPRAAPPPDDRDESPPTIVAQ